MTDREYRRAYSRGYNAGMGKRWPDHRPPVPSDPIAAKLVASLQELRDAVDNQLAMLDPEDEWQTTLGEPMDRATEALAAVTTWLKFDD